MLELHDYWRSSASYRVRIALELKGLPWHAIPVDLRTSAQRDPQFLKRNPQGLVPVLEDQATVITQSLAILEYLEERYPQPALLPADIVARARVRSAMTTIACDIHPLNNLRVTRYLREQLGQDESAIQQWIHHWSTLGLEALEQLACQWSNGQALVGDVVSLADVCLVPQLYNARRFDCDLSAYPTLLAIESVLVQLPAVIAARPVEVG